MSARGERGAQARPDRSAQSRLTNVDLADAVGLSASPCLVRIKRLEEAGYVVFKSVFAKQFYLLKAYFKPG